jgi:transcriptional regulator with XRE-family HTH domain
MDYLEVQIDIGNAIRHGLDKKGWTQKKFAEIMGVSASLVSCWIKNERIPPGDVLIKIALLLDIVDELFPTEQKEQLKNLDFRLEILELKDKIQKLEEKFAK